MTKVISLILGGGAGSRLFPLTKDRSKPAVPIGGKYRLIDIPISNCLNSDINRIFILTQFNSASLNKHINNTYRFDNFQNGFVDILAAEQTMESTDWYQGTADAVRKNLKHLLAYRDFEQVLILSGDQIYNMDYANMMHFHKEVKADVSVSVIPCNQTEAKEFGIAKLQKDLIVDFIEKPKDEKVLEKFKSATLIQKRFPEIEKDREYVASMGIYLFNKQTLLDFLDTDHMDFGKHIIPEAIKKCRVGGYQFDGYWEDVGTIPAFLKANLDFTSMTPQFDFHASQIYTHARFLPASTIFNSTIDEALIAEGACIRQSHIKKSIIGIRSSIGEHTHIENTILMGADYYESEATKAYNKQHQILDIGIQAHTVIKNAIIDKNTRIGKNCRIVNEKGIQELDAPNYHIRNGIVIVPKDAVIEDNTII